MAMILNIETSTDICSVCISRGSEVLSIRETPRSYSHSEVIAVFIDECFKEMSITAKNLDAVSISRGPGSYTALRIGAATAKGICFAVDIPLISVGTLEALAGSVMHLCGANDLVIPMIDARRKEVYHAIYNRSFENLHPVAPIILDETTFKDLSIHDKIHFCGDGVPKSKDILTISNAQYHDIECSARHMVKMSNEKFDKKMFEDIAYYEPNYYKGANITVQKKNILR
ncbi:MAG: tRNA threonylcarbamoyladenosine biosynthesis protein TsaB [Saprospiraceae bacterium]|jgi:tRNA threonylcarbamoyladenosine biosynthesis protein TsaB|tara:strand:- start:1910 stop:2596 length:687 start_codon:yes stop_codon:yes gene_type:complete